VRALYRLTRFMPKSALDTVRRIDQGLLALMPPLAHSAGGVVFAVRKGAATTAC
jgi:hypothetical protein